MRGPPVVLTNTLGRPVTNVISERGAVPMTVVNTLGEPVTLVNSGGEPVTLFNANGTLWDYPFSLFSNNEQGAWYDPSDRSTLFQDSAGTTPVTAVEQPVRLMLDRSGRGNHATAPNDASRPVLRARYNLLTYSEQFDNAAWVKASSTVTANAANAPDGTTTADKQIVDNAAVIGSFVGAHQSISKAASAIAYTYTVFAKAAEFNEISLRAQDSAGIANRATVSVNIATGAITSAAAVAGTFASPSATVTALANGWYLIALTFMSSADTFLRVYANADDTTATTGNGTSGILLWGAQLLTAADQSSTGGAYQRIAAATDYDTSDPVWRPYLAFDGSDDSLSTSSIDFSGTDEVTVFAGVHKASDAALGILAELSADSDTTAGTFAFAAPASPTTNRVLFTAGGTTRRAATTTAADYNAPVTLVLTGLGDISGDATTLRANGVQAAQNTGDQGTGNFANAALFIGRRNNTSFPFNGRLTSLIVLGRTATAAEISATESWVNGKTGAY